MPGDSALRAITDDGAFRVMTVQTTDTVRGAIAAQRAHGSLARVFADLLTGSVLVRETMAPTLRVQGILQGRNPKSRMVADAHPNGDTRGLIQLARGESELVLGRGALLQMIRTLTDGSLQQGIVEVPEQGGVSEALMQYMQSSEQVFSLIAVGCVFKDDAVVAAGGYIVQLLPEATQDALRAMTEHMSGFERMENLLARGVAEPEQMMDVVLTGMKFSPVGGTPLRYHCGCSEARVAASLATLPRSDIEDLISDGRMLEIACDFCKREYKIGPEMLRGLLSPS